MLSFAAIPRNGSWSLGFDDMDDEGAAPCWLRGACAGFCAAAVVYIPSASPQASAVLHNLDVSFMRSSGLRSSRLGLPDAGKGHAGSCDAAPGSWVLTRAHRPWLAHSAHG